MRRFTTIVLAGGASTRMGTPKALLPFGTETLIERVTRRLAEVSAEVIVVAGSHVRLPALPRSVRVLEDETPLQGPVAGILYGLRAASYETSFVCGCDHPLLAPAIARLLVEQSSGDGAVAVWKGRLQPLVAAYQRHVADVAEAMLARGERRARALVENARLVRVLPEQWITADPSGRSFLDVDTPDAYADVLRLLSAESAGVAPPTPLRLFVYGTLKRGGRFHERYCAGAITVETAVARGRVHTLPAGYPMLVVPAASILGRGSADPLLDVRAQAGVAEATAARGLAAAEIDAWPEVPGELFTFDDPLRRLPPIDELEEFHPGAPSLYQRVLLPVRRERSASVVVAWAYVGEEPRH